MRNKNTLTALHDWTGTWLHFVIYMNKGASIYATNKAWSLFPLGPLFYVFFPDFRGVLCIFLFVKWVHARLPRIEERTFITSVTGSFPCFTQPNGFSDSRVKFYPAPQFDQVKYCVHTKCTLCTIMVHFKHANLLILSCLVNMVFLVYIVQCTLVIYIVTLTFK